jgi:hypothetical protein
MRLMTLGWPQFVAVAHGLLAVAVVVAVILERDISESLYRLEVRQSQQKLGFEVGLLKGFPYGPPEGTWGIIHVTPGGTMDRAGMRSGDVVFNRHGYNFTELSGAISEAASGRTACVFVINAEGTRSGSGREVCWKDPPKASSPDTNNPK